MKLFTITPFILQTIMWAVMRPLLSFFTDFQVKGTENLKGVKGGVVLAINHLNDLDPVLIPASLGPLSALLPVFSVSHEKEYYKNSLAISSRMWIFEQIYGGFLFKLLGAYPAVVGTKGDYERSLKTHIRLLENDQVVAIFPEGSRNREGKVGEGKAGVAYLAWRTGCPVVPVAICGHYMMNPRTFFGRKHHIVVSYGKPITHEELFSKKLNNMEPAREDLIIATQVVMSRIREMYERN